MQHNCILGLIFYTSELQELNAKINLIPITPHILLNGTVIFRLSRTSRNKRNTSSRCSLISLEFTWIPSAFLLFKSRYAFIFRGMICSASNIEIPSTQASSATLVEIWKRFGIG